jgi:hypothetical protein
MIAIICAMSEERNAFLQLMDNIKIEKGKSIKYHDEYLDNLYIRDGILVKIHL